MGSLWASFIKGSVFCAKMLPLGESCVCMLCREGGVLKLSVQPFSDSDSAAKMGQDLKELI